jgi:hypothetical protein
MILAQTFERTPTMCHTRKGQAMFQKAGFRTISALLILFTLIGASVVVARKHKSKTNKTVPAGHAVLWRDATDIRQRNLYLGPGGEAMKPDLSRVTLIEKEKGGYSTKYRVRDASGNVWIAKIGKEAQSETAAGRLLWAIGYFADVNYLVPSVHIEGVNQTLTNVRFSARPKETKRVDGFQWRNNPFIGRREFQGLKIMMALINNWDIKDSNNAILVVPNANGQNELHYEVHDLGGSFGKISHLPRFLQFTPDRNNPKAYAKSRLIDKVKDGQVDLHYSTKMKDIFKHISVSDARWLGGLLSRLSNRQIEDAFRSANYTPDEVRLMTGAVRRRIGELNDLPADSSVASHSRMKKGN